MKGSKLSFVQLGDTTHLITEQFVKEESSFSALFWSVPQTQNAYFVAFNFKLNLFLILVSCNLMFEKPCFSLLTMQLLKKSLQYTSTVLANHGYQKRKSETERGPAAK